MAAPKADNIKKSYGIFKLKIAIEKLQRSLSAGKKNPSHIEFNSDMDEIEEINNVPEDVKEGHFAVVAVEGGDRRRFVVSLSFLTHPTFLGLLEQAAEVYGFDGEGALMIPCKPSKLERILSEQFVYKKEARSGAKWRSIMVKSF